MAVNAPASAPTMRYLRMGCTESDIWYHQNSIFETDCAEYLISTLPHCIPSSPWHRRILGHWLHIPKPRGKYSFSNILPVWKPELLKNKSYPDYFKAKGSRCCLNDRLQKHSFGLQHHLNLKQLNSLNTEVPISNNDSVRLLCKDRETTQNVHYLTKVNDIHNHWILQIHILQILQIHNDWIL